MEDTDMDGRAILIRYKNAEWFHMAQGDCTKLRTLCEHNNESLGSISCKYISSSRRLLFRQVLHGDQKSPL
jgi:hypothetical protein